MEEHAKLTGAHEIIKPEDIARVEAYDHAMKGLLNSINDLSLKAGRGIGSESGVGTGLARGASAVLSHPLEALGRTLLWPTKLFSDAPTKWISPGIEREQEKWAKDDANTRTASLREFNEKKQQDQDARRKAKQRHADAASEAERELFNLDMDPEVRTAAKQRDKFSKDLVGSGLGSDGVRQRMSRYDVIIAEQKQRKEDAKRQKDAEDAWKKDQEEGQRLYESVRSPGDKYRDETAKDEDLFRRKAINEDTLASLRRRHLEDYYREAGAMEAKSLRDSLKTPAEHYAERSKWIHKMAADGLLSPAEEAKLNQNDQRDLKSKLGIKDPMGDYAKDISERYDAMKAGLITPEEYRRYKKDRTKTAADEMVEQKPKMQALGAMGVASREEHALLTNAMIGDPAKQDRQRVLAKLDDLRRSVENLRIPQPQLQSI